MSKKLILFFILCIFVFIIAFLWWNQASKPINPKDQTPQNFTVNKGDSIKTISTKLKNQGLLRSPVAFFLLARFTDLGTKVQAGNFRLSPSMNLKEVSLSLQKGTDDVWITVLEGWRVEEIAMYLAQKLSIPEKEFLSVAKEGYMFPDTYLVPQFSTAEDVNYLMQENMKKKLTENILMQAKNKSLDTHQLLTLASLVEREAKFDKDRKLVASVILNRLKIGMKLDIDATVQYALGYQGKEKTWWKKDLTFQDLEINSPYNTYQNPSLPPYPICNPGIAVIKAVIEAPENNYLYYLSEPNGTTHFSEDFNAHSEKILKYLK